MGRVPEIYIAAQMTLSYPAGDSYDQDPGSGRVCWIPALMPLFYILSKTSEA